MKNLLALFGLLLVVSVPRLVSAHCDSLDGPVVKTAAKSLETGRLGPMLAWVRAQDEAEIKTAFEQTQAIRRLGPAAKELADRFFFETVVRIHRAGEGAPYPGLKPAGGEKDPALTAADKAAETGKLEPVSKLLEGSIKAGLTERFAHLRALKAPGDDAGKGRAWVAAYVAYVHYVAGIHQVAAGKPGEQVATAEKHAEHED
jgi:hypothetical protein